MDTRVPNRYFLRLYASDRDFNDRHALMWAFSAADVIVQFELDQKGSFPKATLRSIEPWREAAHGPWPEHLK